ncbi:hypothetical protein BDU57DRAFT_538797 [Ampelomyces quisqualis]|uniref:Uncharacterized protein n=1 Tax=Ampelomyces quisqualis TaxID=50730 RepID=A0A6A5QR64_AMPQU|nr:hypothetical protein BDU57DRAFT_538797 [Ampelomyces quisqualis]
MFGASMPICRFLDQAERIRANHIAQPTQEQPRPAAHPAREWEFLDTMAAHPNSPSDSSESSESSESLSSDSSEDTICLPVRPSTPHYEVPESAEMMPFPDLEPRGESEAHCSTHCFHLSCKKTRVINKNRRIQRECTCAGTKDRDQGFDVESVAHVTLRAAKSAYRSVEHGREVTISLPAALALVQRLRSKGELDIWHFLLASPSYTKTTIHTAKRYASAAKDANSCVLYGFEDTLTVMLRGALNESRVMTVKELEAMLMACMRWDCQEWVKKWVWKKGAKGNLQEMRKETEGNEGLRVLIQKAEECVKDVVGALVWWEGEGQLK